MPFPPPPSAEKKASLLSLKNLKRYRWPALVASVLGGPYAYFEGGDSVGSAVQSVREWVTTSSPAKASPDLAASGRFAAAGGYGTMSTGAAANASPTQLQEILNFDVSPGWIASRWPEVSQGMVDVELTGQRVLLVTGSQPHDLAGSLTYYFNRDERLERIRFEGVCGDTRPLVAFLVGRFRFVRCREDVPGTDVFQVHRDGKAYGDLRIRSAPVVRADSPLGRYSVSLAIDRPR